MIPSYPKIWSFSTGVPMNPWDGEPCIVQEKVDGSQVSFRIDENGELEMRSKGQPIHGADDNKMFAQAWFACQRRAEDGLLGRNLIYRGEYLSKPKHNTLTYGRIPHDSIVIFDVQDVTDTGPQFTSYESTKAYADYAQFETVPLVHEGTLGSPDDLLALLDRESFLGGTKIEGVVMKRYDLWVEKLGQPLFCKYVSEAFKEVHRASWKKDNPTGKDYFLQLADRYAAPARWIKAVQHLREAGELEESPRDIGKLIVEVKRDIDEECADEIMHALYKHWQNSAGRKVTAGLPEWYKEKLLRDSFEDAA